MCIIAVMIQPGFSKKTKIPQHPSKINYSSLDWKIPLGTPYRTVASNGLKLYIAQDRTLPQVAITGYYRAGTINDPVSKKGLGGFSVHCMRTCGTEAFPADTLDAILDQFAISISLSLSETMLSVNAAFLSQFTDTALYILDQILFHPVFDPDKIEKERAIVIQAIQHRFDNPEPVVSAAYTKVMYPHGTNSLLSTEQSIRSITRQDMIEFRNSAFRTENAIVSAAGDFDKKEMMTALERIFPKADTTRIPSFVEIAAEPATRIFIIHKEISQAYVRIGLPIFKRPHPDYYAITVFNQILGGGGFTSRLGTAIRSDAGLTYSIYSNAESNYIYPATFFINFFTKYETVNTAIAMTLKEVDKLLTDGVSPDELMNAKNVLIDGLPSMFRSKEDIVETYAWNEYYGRPDNQYVIYPEQIKALTRDDILTIAKKHITPDKFVYTIVGDTNELFSAAEAGGFSIAQQPNITILSPEQLYDTTAIIGVHKR